MPRASRITILLMAGLALVPASGCAARQGVASGGDGRVVLLHGLGRSSGSMRGLERYLGENGFSVTSIDYPSRKWTVEDLSASLEGTLAPLCADPRGRLDFVTHSLGGIPLRHLTTGSWRSRRPGSRG